MASLLDLTVYDRTCSGSVSLKRNNARSESRRLCNEAMRSKISEYIKLKEEDAVLEIAFARPDKKNALSNQMYSAASAALENTQTNKAVRVVLFSAEGDAFTAGNDIAEFANVANGQADELQAHRFIEALGRAEKPIVAAVSGVVSPNPRKFCHPRSRPATMASRSISFPSLWKV